ncbi:MAG TPA: PIG-L family deacetylase, partial [Candidatus Limnocylindria bacterium]|nr:PIG-L family deacetylase [Candidatus Limnocylindria bacterium]
MNLTRLSVLLVSLLCLVPMLGADGTNGPPKQGEALLKTDILGIWAHPDDETSAAAVLASYALGRKATVTMVYCTRGEGGGNMVGTQAGAALGVLREQELQDCLAKLGVRYHYFLDRLDFGYTENLGVTMEKWDHRETLRRLVRIIRALRPEVIVTMNPAPVPGQHGHHQAAGMLAIEAFDLAGDPDWFPEQLSQEGLRAWQTRKLYYGGPAGTGATVDLNVPLPNGRTAAQVAGEALANHRSQG